MFEGVSDFKPITTITRGSGSKYIYKAKAMGMKVTVGTEIQQFKENEGWIGKSFKGMEHKTQWIFKRSNGNTEFLYILNIISRATSEGTSLIKCLQARMD